jgi:hypothetical protein
LASKVAYKCEYEGILKPNFRLNSLLKFRFVMMGGEARIKKFIRMTRDKVVTEYEEL